MCAKFCRVLTGPRATRTAGLQVYNRCAVFFRKTEDRHDTDQFLQSTQAPEHSICLVGCLMFSDTPPQLALRHVLFEAPFWWWFVGSWVGFGLVMVFWTIDRAGYAVAWVYRKTRKA